MGSPIDSALNNPGNLRKSADIFQGEVLPSKSNSFKQFKDELYGYRAMASVLLTYFKKYGANTIAKIIGRYAPPSENKTESYIDFVSKQVGISKDQPLILADFYSPLNDPLIRKIIKAMATIEQGKKPNELNLVQGYTLFLKDKLNKA